MSVLIGFPDSFKQFKSRHIINNTTTCTVKDFWVSCSVSSQHIVYFKKLNIEYLTTT